MTKRPIAGAGLLLLSILVGFCLSASCVAIFSKSIAFSIFPVIAFVLSAHVSYQRYVNCATAEGMGILLIASAMLGFFLYITLIRVAYQSMGSNVVSTLICLLLFFGIMVRYGKLNHV